MSLPGRGLAAIRYRPGISRTQEAADAAGLADLDFGAVPASHWWLVRRVFIRGAAGMTVRLFVGTGAPGTIVETDEVDAITANPAVNSADEIWVGPNEHVWARITGAGASTLVSGQIRYRVITEEVFPL